MVLNRLADVGYDVGVRMLELLVYREKAGKREVRILGILSFLHTNVWKSLFGKTADSLERGTSVCFFCLSSFCFFGVGGDS